MYTTIVYMQGDEAYDAIDMDDMIEYLSQWDNGDIDDIRAEIDCPAGYRQLTDGEYTVVWHAGMGSVCLYRALAWEELAGWTVDSAGSSANVGTWAGIIRDDAGKWVLLTETSYGAHTIETCDGEDDARDRMAIAAIDGEPGPDDVDEDYLDAIDAAYRACALWSTPGDDGEPLDHGYYADDLPDTSDVIRAFMVDCALLLDRAYARGYTPEQAGHDLWLTREHHGAGFWDRGLGAIGDALTDYAHALGSGELYEADGSLYFG